MTKNLNTADDCLHGREHHHHHHHHVGLAEGITPYYVRKLQIAMVLGIVYFAAQVLGSFYSGSLALLADAGHKLADIGAIALALMASWFSHLSTSPRKTFGFYRLEILAALANGMLLFLMATVILWEAFLRVLGRGHLEIEGGVMLAVAGLGLLLNLVAARVLFPAREFNLNVKGALFHIMADVISSLGTMLTALGILMFHISWLDSVISVVIASLVLHNAIRIFFEAFNILMEAAPQHLDVGRIRDHLVRQPGVSDVHDLHVWTITTGKNALLAHVRVQDDAFRHETAQALEASLRGAFDLCHITVQLEPPGFEEELPPF
jgi:cobalt-zinc-cadmium efflux system protein